MAPPPSAENVSASMFFFLGGYCKHGPACRFAHGTDIKQAYESFTPGNQAAGGPGFSARGAMSGRGNKLPARCAGRGQQGGRQPRAQHVQPAHLTRAWWTTASPSAAGPCFRVMSYNVLADELAQSHRAELYRSTHPDLLAWDRRWSMIQQEVHHLHPDIVCFQEVDHWSDVAAGMSELGYEGSYAQRSGHRNDGCATFWRPNCFQSVAISQLNFNDFDMRDNVGLVTLLQHKQQQQDKGSSDSDSHGPASSADALIAVANTHILFNPKRGDVKLGQLRLLIQHLQQFVSEAAPAAAASGGVSALVMGDMNHTPHTPIYQFMRQGWLDCLRQHRKDLAGTGVTQKLLRTPHGMRRSRSYGGVSTSLQQQQFMQLQQQHSLSAAQQQQSVQQLSVQLPPQSSLQFNRGEAFREVQHSLQQQQQLCGGQQQSGGQLQQVRSAPVLTLRRLKSAGWEPEELVIATGGAHGTHLQHIIQQEQQQAQAGQLKKKQQQAPLQQRQQFQQQEASHGSVETTGNSQGAASGSAAADESQPLLSRQQHAVHRVTADLSLTNDSGEDMDLATEKEDNHHHQQQQTHLQQVQHNHHLRWYSDDEHHLSADAGGTVAAGSSASRPSAYDAVRKHKKARSNSTFTRDGTISTASCGDLVPSSMPPHQLQQTSNTVLQQQQQQQQCEGSVVSRALPSVLKSAGTGGWGRELWDEPLPMLVGDGIARHSLMLRSCYAEVLGSEPEYTSCHDSFYGTVDYIWYTPQAGQQQLKPVAVLLPPAVEQHVLPTACLPNRTLPSDHISLVCDFLVRRMR